MLTKPLESTFGAGLASVSDSDTYSHALFRRREIRVHVCKIEAATAVVNNFVRARGYPLLPIWMVAGFEAICWKQRSLAVIYTYPCPLRAPLLPSWPLPLSTSLILMACQCLMI